MTEKNTKRLMAVTIVCAWATLAASIVALFSPSWFTVNLIATVNIGLVYRCDDITGQKSCQFYSSSEMSKFEAWFEAVVACWALGTIMMLIAGVGVSSHSCKWKKNNILKVVTLVAIIIAVCMFITAIGLLCGYNDETVKFDNSADTHYDWGLYVAFVTALLSGLTLILFGIFIHVLHKNEKNQYGHHLQRNGNPPQNNEYPIQSNAYPLQQNGYPLQSKGKRPQNMGYSPQRNGYPIQSNAYPLQRNGYPLQLQSKGYPLQSHGYPIQINGYPVQRNGYPLESYGYPLQSNGYTLQSNGYPLQSYGYPLQSNGYPLQSNGYPLQSNGYPLQSNYPLESYGYTLQNNGNPKF